uniref:Integrase core domain containing protein n=1 Tax=Solanum tuberosum TaxID=4113 RepID=M1DFF9_SOLTU
MATLLHHMKPWMQMSIVESEVRMVTMVDQKVQAVHKRLDAFESSSIRTELDSLRADIDTIIGASTYEPESAPTTLAGDTMLDALFSEDTTQPESTRDRGKRPRSNHISDTTEEARAKNRER